MIISLKHVIAVIVAFIVVVAAVIGVGLYMHLSSGPRDAEKGLTALIESRDAGRITKIAMDEETQQFILKLSPTSKVLASDAQQVVDVNGVVTAHFPCLVDGLSLNVYMKTTEKTWLQHISPHWQLFRASLKRARIGSDGNVLPVGAGA